MEEIRQNDNQLFFDTDCIDFLENKWLLSRKKVIVSAPNFYFNNEDNRVLIPLKKAKIKEEVVHLSG